MAEKPTYKELEKTVAKLAQDLRNTKEHLKRELEERGRSEQAFRKSEEQFLSLIESLPINIFSKNLKGRFTLVNKRFCETLGKAPEEILNKTDYDIHPPDLAKKYIKDDSHVIESQEILEVEEQHQALGGKAYIVNVIKAPLYDLQGQLIGIIGIFWDITERRKVKEALVRSEKKYRDVVESANSVILRWDTEGKIIFINPYGLEFFGYSHEELIGKNVVETIVPETETSTQRDLILLMKDIQKDPDKYKNSENENIRKNGERVWVSWTNKAIVDEKGDIIEILSIGNDITLKKKLEAQLQQAQRMESLGTLAGGIAHDFNNLLMGIQGRISLMLMDTDSSHPFLDHLKGIEGYIKNAADLTKQLLGFARGGKYEVMSTDLNELIDKSAKMFGRTKKEITINRNPQKDIWSVEVDRSQIEQVLLNLYVNAWQSMPGGGELYLATENVIMDADDVKAYDIKSGKYVKISVTDMGIGMDKTTQQKIFDPFFTTKEMGRGMGLGLASTYGIIKNHDGMINVFSEKGKGTTFNIYLPASEEKVFREKGLSNDMLTGKESILLVDDEDMVIEVGKAMLAKIGYHVITAKGGKEAIEIYKKRKDKIDMVVLDMIMPGVGGGEAYGKLKEINPDIKVLLSSGYSINGQATEILKKGCDGFIQKPFNIRTLSEKIREILNRD